MRIAVNAHNLSVAGGLSVGKNIVTTLPKIAPQHQYLMIFPDECGYPSFHENKNITEWKCKAAASGLKKLGLNFSIAKTINQFNPDWIWHLGNYGCSSPPCSQSILVHDSHLVYPEKTFAFESLFYRLKKRILKRALKNSLKSISVLYAQTEVMKNRLAETFQFPMDRIKLCPQAVSYSVRTGEPNDLLPELANYSDKFILIVLSKFYGHKNFQGIVELYKNHREALKDTICVWTVSPDQHPMAPKILDQIREFGLEDLIINIGPIQQDQLNRLYASGDALFLPTYLESFSGTYLEAMHFDVPIITSDLDFARCICEEAACYVDPTNSESMLKGIRQMVDSPDYRNQLREKAQKQKLKHVRTWDDIVRSVLDAENIEHDIN